ncbi:MAG: sodium:alanine symporter family protein [Bacteroidota bacterium]|nr:sodium:alanine symporter family protein [Bacteroidota bacterium]MDE2834045.1 sodium:alanine symporter family protein [Bacteroidota bacterium]MDE2957484.1 sodium:alanine symporter family protein [Bacteroidota bacterium]
MLDFVLEIQGYVDWALQYPLLILLLGTGIFLTLRLGFVQFRKFGHGVLVAMGKYDDPDDDGDVTHFQALTTALSATVGIGNIAGVALAIHWGGPGAVFWMWITALLGMCTKFTEVTLAQRFRVVDKSGSDMEGTVSGGPMYYIEKGLGLKFKPLAIFVAAAMVLVSFLTGNAIQANTVADLMNAEFAIPVWITGGITACVVGLVILGGIRRIGSVTSILAPAMGVTYVIGGLVILVMFYDQVIPAFASIFVEAFNPTAGVAGVGIGVFIQTLLWGVRRGLFSNEAGQGSAPIAHSAAKTEEPVSEGAVALLEPFIDTIVICTITALVLLSTGVWNEPIDSTLTLDGGDYSYVEQTELGYESVESPPAELLIDGGQQIVGEAGVWFAWHEVRVQALYSDAEQTQPFTGIIYPEQGLAVSEAGDTTRTLYGPAIENGAPLTAAGFKRGLGGIGNLIVVISVFLFGISTAISWSYYGDRCSMYLFGKQSILVYKLLFVVMHFVGAVTSLNVIWNIGDTALSLVTIPNVIALLLLSGVAKKLTDDYFNAYRPGITRDEYLTKVRQRAATRKEQT